MSEAQPRLALEAACQTYALHPDGRHVLILHNDASFRLHDLQAPQQPAVDRGGFEGGCQAGAGQGVVHLRHHRPQARGFTEERGALLVHGDAAGHGVATVQLLINIFFFPGAHDVLVQLPYESFVTSVEAFIEQAASDPDVLAIKQTLYRTSGGDSPIVRALIAAAEAGRQVVALVELKARFDEAANIAWARVLERAGVHVAYGIVGLKTHAKTALVVRREGDVIRRYCHVGTGNYNPQTARLYEDLGLLTCDPEIGADVSDLFNYLTGYSHQQRFQRLLVAPRTLRPGLLELIGEQARAHGRIVIKTNHCVDPEMIEALYAASTAGARVDLIVRSSCAVRPGVPDVSEHIRVRSLVGRWLEHSRIYSFGNGARARWYIGSADIMGRNLDDRVEAAAPVLDPTLRARLETIVEVLLADDRLAWTLDRDGVWHRPSGARGICAHELLAELARGAEQHVAECIGRGRSRTGARQDGRALEPA